MEFDDLLKALFGVGYVLYQLYAAYKKHTEKQKPPRPRAARRVEPAAPRAPEPQPTAEGATPDRPRPAAALAPLDPRDARRARLVEQTSRLVDRAQSLAETARVQRATYPFARVLEDQVVTGARSLLGRLAAPGSAEFVTFHEETLGELELIEAQLASFVAQRRDPALRARLGDADALALSCYRPVIGFAQAKGLELSSAYPATQLGGFDLSIWTGFIPTGLAPIFLPERFFEDVFWWPALAHEIGHDFLAATRGVDEGLRRQLGLPDEKIGTQPLQLGGAALSYDDVFRLFGGWFEELFCDVFGALMLGPAYGYAMAKHFAAPDNPRAIALVRFHVGGLSYDIHPPRHLRVLACAHLLERMGHERSGAELLEQWAEVHGDLPEHLLFRHDGGVIGLPLEPFAELALGLADRLYDEQLDALAGYRLIDIPGVGFGPHLEAETERASARLLAGQSPARADPRAVIAGAVLATRAAPAQASSILLLARAAIAAEGTFEHAVDAYSAQAATRAGEQQATGRAALREAFVLYTLLGPRAGLRGSRRPGDAPVPLHGAGHAPARWPQHALLPAPGVQAWRAARRRRPAMVDGRR